MLTAVAFGELIGRYAGEISPIISIDETEPLASIDLSVSNDNLDHNTFSDVGKFSEWINQQIANQNARYGIGGYSEHRKIYANSTHFDTHDEPRRLHLGIDIWAPAGTQIFASLPGNVHSVANNDSEGDYGGTIIIEHLLDSQSFFTLYGHLAFRSIVERQAGKPIASGQLLGRLGEASENGNWPAHLHFQIILDLQGKQGDYPGVCKYSERSFYLQNCPDPGILLRHLLK